MTTRDRMIDVLTRALSTAILALVELRLPLPHFVSGPETRQPEQEDRERRDLDVARRGALPRW